MDLGALEEELGRIPDVRAARIVADDRGAPIEVHILAARGKEPKQLVRDVQSVAIASAGVDFDRRIVSIVQLEDADEDAGEVAAAPPPSADAPSAPEGSLLVAAPVDRVVIETVLVAKHDLRAHATVTLRRDDESFVGTAEGTVASSARWRIVAEAALAALRLLEPMAERMAVELASVLRIGEQRVGIVTLMMVNPPHEELLAGVAPVRGGAEEDAVARALLDATNRRLSQLR